MFGMYREFLKEVARFITVQSFANQKADFAFLDSLFQWKAIGDSYKLDVYALICC